MLVYKFLLLLFHLKPSYIKQNYKMKCIVLDTANQKFLQKSDDFSVIRSESFFTAYLIEHNLPISSADHMALLFKKMFPDSKIANKYGCGRTKTTAIIAEMAKREKNAIVENLKKVPFSIASDGSNKGDKKLFPIVVTYFNDATNQIEASLLSMSILEGDSTGENIAKLMLDTIMSFEIPLENCISLSADNAPVMIGKNAGVASFFQKEIPHLFVQGCLCHLIDLAAEKGAACLPSEIEESIIDIYYYLEKSVKRKDKLKVFQQMHDIEVRKILKHVSTHWLSLNRCLKRLNEQWDPLTTFFKEEAQSVLSQSASNSNLKYYKIPKIKQNKTQTKTSDVSVKKDNPCIPVTSENKLDTSTNSKLENFRFQKHKKEAGVPSKADLSTKGSESVSYNAASPQSKVILKQSRQPKNSYVCTGKKRSIKEPLKTANKKVKLMKTNTVKSSKSEILSREERLFLFLSSDMNKAFVNFLLNTLPVFEEYNIVLQSKEPKIHILRSMLLEMFKRLLSRFVLPSIIKNSSSLMNVGYQARENQKLNSDIVIGQAAFNIISSFSTKKQAIFYEKVRDYYVNTCNYIKCKFPFSDEILINAEVSDLSKIDTMSFECIKYFLQRFPIMAKSLGSKGETLIDDLQSEFCSVQIEEMPISIKSEVRMDLKWIKLNEFFEGKYSLISKLMVFILTLPHSNAECERIFSFTTKTLTQFRSQISAQTLENLLIVKTNMIKSCFEQNFDDDFLKKAKSATTVYNKNSV